MEQDDVILRCKADNVLYDKLAWFRVANLSKSEHAESTLPCRLLTLQPLPQAVMSSLQGNITLELRLQNASRQDEGLYACQVKNTKTAKSTCILRHLSLRDLEAPRILNNFTDQKVNVSATITLHCDAVGTPNPKVVWAKNNHTVEKSSGVILNQNNLTIQRVKKEDSGLYTCTACNTRGCDTSQAYLSVEGQFVPQLVSPTGGDLKTGYLSMILDSEDLPMDEQCERLTYDANKWEFPRDRLKLESSVDDHLTMEDLISYSFQVAKGMEFLSSRKVGTRGLSARSSSQKHPAFRE
ncbi:hypothetical protein GOODEAATRI_007717 [Goodea atripinnis]|uniref:Ig-like domain-containing protein n=1 Tax=Goodea atripinnis TaxID=208336 RepID=A0ABV0NSP4_9TELE